MIKVGIVRQSTHSLTNPPRWMMACLNKEPNFIFFPFCWNYEHMLVGIGKLVIAHLWLRNSLFDRRKLKRKEDDKGRKMIALK